MHTILPAMLTRNDEVVLSFGVTGGHFQPIGQMQLVSNLLDYGMSVQQAIDAPRMFARGDGCSIWKARFGRNRRCSSDAWPSADRRRRDPLGTAQAIWIDRERGLLRGEADRAEMASPLDIEKDHMSNVLTHHFELLANPKPVRVAPYRDNGRSEILSLDALCRRPPGDPQLARVRSDRTSVIGRLGESSRCSVHPLQG